MALEFVGVGDLHLGKLEKIFPDNHVQIVMTEFQKCINYARNNAIKYVIQYGDVSDTIRLPDEARRALITLLCLNTDIEFFFILGNHDYAEEGTHSLDDIQLLCDLGLFPHVKIITKSTVIEIEGVPVHLMPYPVRKTKKDHVNIAHVEINGFKSDSGRRLETEDVFPDDTLLLTGHLHTPQHKDPWYCAGTLYQTNFGETQEKGFHHVRVTKTKSGKLNWEITLVPNKPSFLLENLVIETRADFKLIKSDPSILYKLFIKSDVLVPEDLMTRYPNIEKISGYRSAKELKSVMEDVLAIEYDFELEYKPTEYLGEFLKSKGATKAQIKRAREIASSKLGIKLD